MEAQIDTQSVGIEFDKWLDYDGIANTTERMATDVPEHEDELAERSFYPISPSTTAASDSLSSALKLQIHTAPSSVGPLTPSHGSGSPEVFTRTHIRLSGDTLHEDGTIYRQASLKRKLSSSDDTAGPREKAPKAKPNGSKRPHNVIEKRYRANLNDKIAELRDSVPSLRILQKARAKEHGNTGTDDEDLDGLTPSGKLNKASILTKAVEYIRHLEFRNKRLEDENKSLKERIQTLDRVLAKGGNDTARATAFTTENVIEQSSTEAKVETSSPGGETTQQPTRGMVPAPDSWKQIRQQNKSGDHYGHIYQNASERPRFGGKWTGRVMLGSLAGLMVMEGFSEHDTGTDSREKGLFGIPLEILDGWAFLRSPRIYLATFAEYCRAGGVIPLIKGFLALSILAFCVFVYLFNSRPHPEREYEKETSEEPQTARPASPIEVRRRAWSTSMQALGLPHHSFFPEWLAVTTEWISYTIRYIFGPQMYTHLTGRSVEDEIARIKAWDIAIDAQLAGGDVEVSRSRLLLTIFGSGTLPRTPIRLMQKALHCRVLLWNVGLPGTTASRLANCAANYFANRQWRHARQMHECLSVRDADRLPGYLNYLLQMDCDEVFNNVVTQRASNLMYNRPTSEYAEDSLMDVVVDDHAIRSPLDAIAAWRSTCALREALDAALQAPDSPDLLREHIQAALEIAPPGSAAETRALAVHAVLSPGRRSDFYNKAKRAMSPASRPTETLHNTLIDPSVPFFIDSSTPVSARSEIAACLQCAQIMLTLDQQCDLPEALKMVANIRSIVAPTSTMLTIAPYYYMLSRMWRAGGSGGGHPLCRTAAGELYGYITNQLSKDAGDSNKMAAASHFLHSTWDLSCIPESQPHSHPRSQLPSRRQSLVSNDTGYASLSEQEEHTIISDALKNDIRAN